MKRLSTILLSLLLAVTVVALSGGVAFIDCCHEAEKMEAEAACSCGGDGCECCCDDEQSASTGDTRTSPCTSVTLHKLAPTDVAQTFHPSFTDYPLPLAPFLALSWDAALTATPIVKAHLRNGEIDTGPPRSYLRRLTVLLI